MLKDPYETLGIGRESTAEEIRQAYRQRAKTVHPDKGGGEEAFKELGEAQRLLLDPKRRASFDATGDLDEGEPDNRETVAFAIIAELIEHAMGAGDEVLDSRDVVSDIKDALRSRLKTATQAIEDGRRDIARLRRVGKRFERRKKGPNLIRRMFEARIADHERGIKAVEEKIEWHKAALEMIDNYVYALEAKSPQQRGYAYASLNFGNLTGISRREPGA